MKSEVRVIVPASSANLGPGFDCLGLALALYNELEIAVRDEGLEIEVVGEGAGALPTDTRNLAYRAAQTVFAVVGRRPAGMRIVQRNEIPVGSGLGSSAAAVIGGMVAANALVDGGLSQSEIVRLATALEGHPDNVTPALYGGLTLINGIDDEGLHVTVLVPPPLTVTIVLPDFQLPTAAARAALPAYIPFGDAVFNIGRTALLVHALSRADYAELALAMEDRLHQPYRTRLVPGLGGALTAARQAGAAGASISGAGPSVIAFAPDGHEAIAEAIAEAFADAGLASRAWTLAVDLQGARLAPEPRTG